MLCILVFFIIYFQQGLCLWTKGIVHYAINSKDYDLHSQEIITSVLSDVQRELCIKFFDTPPNYSATAENKILYITNPDKRKNCPPDTYNYTGSVVDMTIGYKCITRRDVTRILVDMLRASIHPSKVKPVNSNDLIRKYQELEEDPASPSLLAPIDRNYINSHYHSECDSLSVLPHRRSSLIARTVDDAVRLEGASLVYYQDKLWPLGVVMYGVEKSLKNSKMYASLQLAMTTIELGSCIVFQEIDDDEVLRARSLLWFGTEGAEAPQLGFIEGNQSLSLESMVNGAPGHTAHTLNLLLRSIGMPMQSNRHDRDYYVIVNWNNVQNGMEHYLEKTPPEAWFRFAYDFDSATHAPANYMCKSCNEGETTFEPVLIGNNPADLLTQLWSLYKPNSLPDKMDRDFSPREITIEPPLDHLWQRTLSMGHREALSESDIGMLSVLYGNICQDRYHAKK